MVHLPAMDSSNITKTDGHGTDLHESTTQPSGTDEPEFFTEEATSLFYRLETVFNTTDTIELITHNVTTNITDQIIANSSTEFNETSTSTTTRVLATSITTTQIQWSTVNSNVCAAVFITIFIITSIVCNFFIIASLRHRHFKSVALYSLISNLCVVLVFDSLLNMSLVLGATVANMWPYGLVLCQLSTFFVNVLRVETLLSLFTLVLDRLIAIKWSRFYDNNMNRAKANILSGVTWLYSTAFTLIILIGPESVPMNYFPHSYLCNLTANTSLTYIISLLMFCYVIPLLAIIAMFINIIKISVMEKAEAQALNNGTLYGFEIDMNRTPLSDEIRRAKAVGCLVVVWCLLQGPYIFLHLSYTFTDTSYPENYMSIMYPSLIESIFAWMKFSYATVAPIIIFISWPEAKDELKNFICHKSNVVDSGRSSEAAHDALHKPGVRSSWASSEESTSVPSTLGRSFHVPILLATADGLRLKVARNQRETDIDETGEVISTDRYRESRYVAPEPLPPFGAVETVEECEEGGLPSISKRPTLPYGYNDRYQYAPPSENSSTFQLSLNSGSLKVSPRRTPTSPSKMTPTTTPRSPRTPSSIDYF